MGKLLENLEKQLKIEEERNDAIQCIKIYEALLSVTGSVMSSQWQVLTTIRFERFPSNKRYYSPLKLGLIFLKGLEE